MLIRSFMAASVLVALTFGGTSYNAAHAQPSTQPAEVMIVLAKAEAGEIDPSLQSIAALKRPPFNSFKSMKLLSKPRLTLKTGTPQEVMLPNGRKLRLELERVLPDGRFRVKVAINKPDQNDYLPLLNVNASPGDPFFVAGQSHQGGTLVIGISVGTASK